MNQHRHAIEQASRRWRGGQRTRRKMLISTQALTSPARRASETAMRMTDRTETEEQKVGSVYLRMVAGVHPAGMSETCEALFETLGYGPLRTFFEAAGGEDAFQAYGDAVCAELAAAAVPGGDGGGLAVFGHAVFLNAIAYKVAQAAS